MATTTPPDFIRRARVASPREFVANWWRETGLSEGDLLALALQTVRPCRGGPTTDWRDARPGDILHWHCCGDQIQSLCRRGATVLKCRYEPLLQRLYGGGEAGALQAMAGDMLLDPPAWARVIWVLRGVAPPPSWFNTWLANWRRGYARSQRAS